MKITNKFQAPCSQCGSLISPGTQVDWTKGLGIRHLTCPEHQPCPECNHLHRYDRCDTFSTFTEDDFPIFHEC